MIAFSSLLDVHSHNSERIRKERLNALLEIPQHVENREVEHQRPS